MGVQISQLSIVEPSAGQSMVVYDPSKGDDRRFSLNDFLAWLEPQLIDLAKPITQYEAPQATGFSVQINDDSDDVHLILTPGGAYADGKIVLPNVGQCVDQQIVVVNCTQAVATLVVDGNGATAVLGAPTALLANGYFTLQYDVVLNTWYRIG